nr:NF-kappa-B essential modulator isoform X1 [Leptinotarsa decemlineata]
MFVNVDTTGIRQKMALGYKESTAKFQRIPSEPCPLPSLGSDEESFVVLGHSLSSQEILNSEEIFTPVVTNVIEESKRLLNNELSALEQLSLGAEGNDCSVDSIGGSQKGNKGREALQTSQAKSLEKSSLPGLTLEEGICEESHNVISLPTISTELSPDEVQSRISQIIEENMHLKDVLIQNNMSMKSQIDRIVAWQEDVQKVHQAHKEKLIEAKKCIEKLKDECIVHCLELSNMEEKMAEQKNQISKRDGEINRLQSILRDREHQCYENLVRTTDNNLKEFEVDVANKKIKELEMELQLSIAERENLSAENLRLKQLAKENENVIKELEKIKASEEAIETVRCMAEEKENKFKVIINELQSRLPQIEEVANSRAQLANIQVALTQAEQSRAAAYCHIAQMNNRMTEQDVEITNLKQKVSELNQRNIELESQAANKDEMFALQTQLEVFRTDFEAEKSAKEVIKAEKERLVEDLQNLQRRNQQLQEEIEMIRDNREYVVYPSNSRERTTPNPPLAPQEHDSPPPRRYACPICSLQYRSLRLLEDHVDMCVGHRT